MKNNMNANSIIGIRGGSSRSVVNSNGNITVVNGNDSSKLQTESSGKLGFFNNNNNNNYNNNISANMNMNSSSNIPISTSNSNSNASANAANSSSLNQQPKFHSYSYFSGDMSFRPELLKLGADDMGKMPSFSPSSFENKPESHLKF